MPWVTAEQYMPSLPSVVYDLSPASGSAQQISDRYRTALPYSHLSRAKGELWSGSTLICSFAPEAASTLTVDRSAANRRTCSVVLTEGSAYAPDGSNVPVVPKVPTDPFDVRSGNELRLYRGIQFDNGDQEYVQLITAGLDSLDVDDSGRDLVITVNGSDRSKAIQRAGFTFDSSVYAPSNPTWFAILFILGNAILLPAAATWQYNFAHDSFNIPATPIPYKTGDDPWQLCTDLATAAGYELFFDPAGTLTYQPVPDPTKAALAYSYDEGSVSIMTHLRRSQSRDKSANYIIRDGQGSGTTSLLRGVAFDADDKSPTYYLGPYGRQTDQQTSTLITSQAQADAVAKADLYKALGEVEAVQISAIPKPDHDVNDVIEVTRGRAGVTVAYYVLDAYSMGLGQGATLDLTSARRIAWNG